MRPWTAVLLALAAGTFACRSQRDHAQSSSTDSPSKAELAPAAPDGRNLVVNNCLSCHGEEVVEQQRLSEAQWTKVVKKMATWGSQIEPQNESALIAYLATKYGPDAGRYRAATVSPVDAAQQLATLEDGPFAGGDAERGRTLFASFCAACHGSEGRGAIGVNLVDRPVLHRTGDFAKTIRTGRGKMPAIAMSDAQIADVVAHLRRLR